MILGAIPKGLIRGDGRVENRTNRDNPKCSIVKIGQNTKKNPEDLRTIAVIQTPVEDHHL